MNACDQCGYDFEEEAKTLRIWHDRALAAEAKLAKVEALAKEWEGRAGWTEEGHLYFRTHARRLRECLGEKA